MAEHTHSGTAELGAPMDYREHERTYNGFLILTKLGIIATLNTMISLLLFAFGAGGFWLGVTIVVLTLIALAIGMALKGSAKPLLAVTILGAIFFVLSVA